MGSGKILIADDQFDRLAPLAGSLREAGYTVATSRDSDCVMNSATSGETDLLITNYQLKNDSGVELCQRLRHDARTANLPTVLLTAPGYSVETETAARAGIRRIIPAGARSEIVATVHDVLSRRAA